MSCRCSSCFPSSTSPPKAGPLGNTALRRGHNITFHNVGLFDMARWTLGRPSLPWFFPALVWAKACECHKSYGFVGVQMCQRARGPSLQPPCSEAKLATQRRGRWSCWRKTIGWAGGRVWSTAFLILWDLSKGINVEATRMYVSKHWTSPAKITKMLRELEVEAS